MRVDFGETGSGAGEGYPRSNCGTAPSQNMGCT